MAHQPTRTLSIIGGHVQLAAGGASVQLGATATVEVDITVQIVDEQTMLAWLKKHERFFSDRHLQTLKTDTESGNLAKAALGAIGLVFSGDYDKFQNAETEKLTTDSIQQMDFWEALHKLRNHEIQILESIQVQGISMKPTQAFVFARVAKVLFGNGSQATFVDLSAPVAADADGDTRGVRASDKQKIRTSNFKKSNH